MIARRHSNPRCSKKDCRYARYVTCTRKSFSEGYGEKKGCDKYYTDADCDISYKTGIDRNGGESYLSKRWHAEN